MPKAKNAPVTLHNPFTEGFMPRWEEWKAYKKEQHRFTYKPIGEQAAIDHLFELSAGNEEIAWLIIKEARANGWKGLFQLKNLPNATNITNPANGNKAGSVSRARIQAAKNF